MKQRLAGWLQRFGLLRWGLLLGMRLFIPAHYVGAVGAVFNHAGQILLVKHVFRPYYPWGLPGGWVERDENPANTVQRELSEELHLPVKVKRLLHCEPQGFKWGEPPGLGLAFYCRLVEEEIPADNNNLNKGYEVLAVQWINPAEIEWNLTPLDQKAINLAKEEFEREQ